MLTISSRLAAAALALLASGAALADATVKFTDSDRYTDVAFSTVERERELKEFSDYFAKLGKRLPAGQTLNIEVLDIDLAGRVDLRGRSARDIRIMTGGADWPHMALRYELVEAGKVIRSGESQLSNMNYLNQMTFHSNSDPMRHEKEMIDDWFTKTFGIKTRG